jgi:hypothetical protein
MDFEIVWLPKAEQELANLWLQATDRWAVTHAVSELDSRLLRNPENEGESRPSGRRITFCKPLGIFFRVYQDRRLVQVSHVWRY